MPLIGCQWFRMKSERLALEASKGSVTHHCFPYVYKLSTHKEDTTGSKKESLFSSFTQPDFYTDGSVLVLHEILKGKEAQTQCSVFQEMAPHQAHMGSINWI